MKCFTISSGFVTEGISVEKLTLKWGGVTIDAVIAGEEGRGRERGVLPIDPAAIGPRPCEKQGRRMYTDEDQCHKCGEPLRILDQYGGREHPAAGTARDRIFVADVGQTRAGKPKLVRESSAAKAADFAIVAFRTKIGFRGSNRHTGDRTGETDICGCLQFADFPGEIICTGVIAQGAAGRAGSGSQIIAVMPRGVVFRTGYGGRLYGSPSAHYYVFDGEKILAATWDERAASDCF